jgi:hypothetical protein
MKRDCPSCGRPAVGVWRLLSLGALRRAHCPECGATLVVSPLSALVVAAVGTWLPLAGALAGAFVAARFSDAPGLLLVGAAVGLATSAALFAALYFRAARLVVM